MRMLILLGLSLSIVSCSPSRQEHEQRTDIPESIYQKRGDQLVALTFDTLRKSLLTTISAQGVSHAIAFCNEQAYPLTSLYQGDSVTVRRASQRFRNPNNRPDSLEQAVLSSFEVNGPSTKLIRTRDQVHYIKPILLQPMCLSCHGVPDENITPETRQAIEAHYPQDMATGYSSGDLRGIWHIAFTLKR